MTNQTIPAGYPKARVPSLAKRVRELVEALKAGGETIASVEISPEGGVTVLTTAGARPASASRANEWDEVLSRQ